MERFSNDRTWPLNIEVEGENTDDIHEVCIRVRGDYTIGSVMALIGEKIGPKYDWSDYALWWPSNKRWLKQYKMTLDQVDVIANTKLLFTSMHKPLRIQFPDLNIVEFRVDFSVNILNVVEKLCTATDIVHSEELSLARPLTNKELKRNNPNLNASPLQRNGNGGIYETLTKSYSKNTLINNNYQDTLMNQSNGSLLSNKSLNTISSNGSMNGSFNSLAYNDHRDILLPHPKSSVQKARLNAAWLNSSISLYEQNVAANDLLLLKFKFFSFLDLNPLQLTRVNYLYEQLKWAILSEEISCSEDEMYTLAGLMFRITNCSGKTIPDSNGNGNHCNGSIKPNGNAFGNGNSLLVGPKINGLLLNGRPRQDSNGMNSSISSSTNSDFDEVDCELTKLERQYPTNDNGALRSPGIISVPQLTSKLKISCQKIRNSSSTLARLKYNAEKTYFAVFCEKTLTAYRPQDFDQTQLIPMKKPIISLDMNNCEVHPDVIASQQKYCFKIIESNGNGSSFEYCVRCNDEKQYAQWFTACKQASQGRTMAHPSYSEQCKSTLKLLEIQTKVSKNSKEYDKKELKKLLEQIDPSHYTAPRFLKRRSIEQVIAKIKAAYENFSGLTLVDAQMNFIETCKNLRDYGITLFVIRFNRSRKEELLGAMPDKLVLIDSNSGKLKKTWRYKNMMMWNINWEVKQMKINFEDETLEFECLSADCKVIHEFIGGYIYMSMREERESFFDEEQFLKLTGGWNDEFENEDEHIAMCRREAWANYNHQITAK